MTTFTITATASNSAGSATATATADTTAASTWPNASNTGVPAGTTLTNSGSITVTVAGTVVQNKNVTGSITVKAQNVTIKNCRINANGGSWGVDSDGFNANVTDCEIFNQKTGNAAVIGEGGTFTRLNCYGFENGIVTQGNNLVQDCYIHDLGNPPNGHVDGVSIQGGSNTTVRHCHIESWDTSCVFIKNDFGPNPMKNHIVDNNRLINTPGQQTAVTVYSIIGPQGGVQGTQFTNNIMQAGTWGYFSVEGNTVVWANNRDYITGNLIPAP